MVPRYLIGVPVIVLTTTLLLALGLVVSGPMYAVQAFWRMWRATSRPYMMPTPSRIAEWFHSRRLSLLHLTVQNDAPIRTLPQVTRNGLYGRSLLGWLVAAFAASLQLIGFGRRRRLERLDNGRSVADLRTNDEQRQPQSSELLTDTGSSEIPSGQETQDTPAPMGQCRSSEIANNLTSQLDVNAGASVSDNTSLNSSQSTQTELDSYAHQLGPDPVRRNRSVSVPAAYVSQVPSTPSTSPGAWSVTFTFRHAESSPQISSTLPISLPTQPQDGSQAHYSFDLQIQPTLSADPNSSRSSASSPICREGMRDIMLGDTSPMPGPSTLHQTQQSSLVPSTSQYSQSSQPEAVPSRSTSPTVRVGLLDISMLEDCKTQETSAFLQTDSSSKGYISQAQLQAALCQAQSTHPIIPTLSENQASPPSSVGTTDSSASGNTSPRQMSFYGRKQTSPEQGPGFSGRGQTPPGQRFAFSRRGQTSLERSSTVQGAAPNGSVLSPIWSPTPRQIVPGSGESSADSSIPSVLVSLSPGKEESSTSGATQSPVRSKSISPELRSHSPERTSVLSSHGIGSPLRTFTTSPIPQASEGLSPPKKPRYLGPISSVFISPAETISSAPSAAISSAPSAAISSAPSAAISSAPSAATSSPSRVASSSIGDLSSPTGRHPSPFRRGSHVERRDRSPIQRTVIPVIPVSLLPSHALTSAAGPPPLTLTPRPSTLQTSPSNSHQTPPSRSLSPTMPHFSPSLPRFSPDRPVPSTVLSDSATLRMPSPIRITGASGQSSPSSSQTSTSLTRSPVAAHPCLSSPAGTCTHRPRPASPGLIHSPSSFFSSPVRSPSPSGVPFWCAPRTAPFNRPSVSRELGVQFLGGLTRWPGLASIPTSLESAPLSISPASPPPSTEDDSAVSRLQSIDEEREDTSSSSEHIEEEAFVWVSDENLAQPQELGETPHIPTQCASDKDAETENISRQQRQEELLMSSPPSSSRCTSDIWVPSNFALLSRLPTSHVQGNIAHSQEDTENSLKEFSAEVSEAGHSKTTKSQNMSWAYDDARSQRSAHSSTKSSEVFSFHAESSDASAAINHPHRHVGLLSPNCTRRSSNKDESLPIKFSEATGAPTSSDRVHESVVPGLSSALSAIINVSHSTGSSAETRISQAESANVSGSETATSVASSSPNPPARVTTISHVDRANRSTTPSAHESENGMQNSGDVPESLNEPVPRQGAIVEYCGAVTAASLAAAIAAAVAVPAVADLVGAFSELSNAVTLANGVSPDDTTAPDNSRSDQPQNSSVAGPSFGGRDHPNGDSSTIADGNSCKNNVQRLADNFPDVDVPPPSEGNGSSSLAIKLPTNAGAKSPSGTTDDGAGVSGSVAQPPLSAQAPESVGIHRQGVKRLREDNGEPDPKKIPGTVSSLQKTEIASASETPVSELSEHSDTADEGSVLAQSRFNWAKSPQTTLNIDETTDDVPLNSDNLKTPRLEVSAEKASTHGEESATTFQNTDSSEHIPLPMITSLKEEPESESDTATEEMAAMNSNSARKAAYKMVDTIKKDNSAMLETDSAGSSSEKKEQEILVQAEEGTPAEIGSEVAGSVEAGGEDVGSRD